MDGRYIYWLVIDLIYLIICFLIKKNKKFYCNFEIGWLLFNIVYLSGGTNSSSEQISYYAGCLSILIVLYMLALNTYKVAKENYVKERI